MAYLSLDSEQLAAEFNAGDYDGVTTRIIQILEFFETQEFGEMDPNFFQALQIVADVILQVLSSERFAINNHLAPELIRRNSTLANMLRLTKFYNADATLRHISSQPNNFVRTLILYSPYCTVRLSLLDLFQAQPYLTSIWVAAILKHRWRGSEVTQRFVDEVIGSPALEKFTLDDPHFPPMEDTSFAYFDATYASPDKDRALRDVINDRTKQAFKREFKMGSDMRRILVISANMNTNHSVYRCLAPMLYALKPDYHLTLFYNKPNEGDVLDTQLFDTIIPLGLGINDSFTYEMLERILSGNYGIVLFSDVGLNRPSIILSNLRLAPIQITTYGHPVTSGNSEIDYYIGGEAVEEAESPQRYYAEKLVLIKGLGVEPIRLDYKPSFPPRKYEWIEIGLSWGDMKFNYPHLLLLKQILENTSQRIRFHFIGINATRLTLLAAQKDLEAVFGAEHIYVSASMQKAQYLEVLENCDLLLDSFHFGSYNRVVDCLTLHKPIITLEGKKAYSRFASALLKQVGMHELVATTSEEFVRKSLRLVDDLDWREAILAKIRQIDFEEKLFNTGNAAAFKGAIDTIVKTYP
jgi:hypothetical protein